MRKLQPKMPKFLAHKIYDASGKPSNVTPLLVGAATFFLPCGFTQALQLYVLSQGKPVVSMKVEGLEYVPSTFTVVQGVPVEWHVDGSQAEGCAQVLTVPDLGLTAYLPPQGPKTIVFVPKETGSLRFSCPMAMTTA